MKFIVDECVGVSVVRWLEVNGYDVYHIAEKSPGITDVEVLQIACRQTRILITVDKDFGELVFRNNLEHCGIILLRMLNAHHKSQIAVLEVILNKYFADIESSFVVATETSIRITRCTIH